MDAVPGVIDDVDKRIGALIADLKPYTLNEVSQELLSVLPRIPAELCVLIAECAINTAFESTQAATINDQLYIVSRILNNIQIIQQSENIDEMNEVVSTGSKEVMEVMPGIPCRGCDNPHIVPEDNEFVCLCPNCEGYFDRS
jgi:hypothetical protein